MKYVPQNIASAWHPVAGLAIACVLPLFYGVTSAGLRSPRPEGP
ncbi:MAG TPA: hypothetical protein VMG13_20855 [Trebonia sp.]|nr:hypothetical protein [Trebonia sp.]